MSVDTVAQVTVTDLEDREFQVTCLERRQLKLAEHTHRIDAHATLMLLNYFVDNGLSASPAHTNVVLENVAGIVVAGSRSET